MVKHHNMSKYNENNSLQNFPFPFLSLLIAKFVKNSHSSARIYFIFLKIVLKQTWDSFNSKLAPQ